MWNSIVFVCCRIALIVKKSAILIHTFAIDVSKYRFSPTWLLPTFSRSKILNFISSETVTACANIWYDFKYIRRFSNSFISKVDIIKKLFLQLCLHLYGIRRRVALGPEECFNLLHLGNCRPWKIKTIVNSTRCSVCRGNTRYGWSAGDQPFCFTAAYLNFPLPSVLNGLANISRKRLQTDEKSRGSSIMYAGAIEVCLFPKTMCFLFQLLEWNWKYMYSQFSRKIFNQFENSFRILIKALEFYKMSAAWLEVAAQKISIFQMENVPPGKTEKKHWISLTLFNRFSSSSHQNNRTVPNACNRRPWKCRSWSTFIKSAHFWHVHIYKETPNVTSRRWY